MTTDTDDSGDDSSSAWRHIDYGSNNRIDDLGGTYSDEEMPTSIPDAETAVTGFNPSEAPPSERDHWLSKLNDNVRGDDRGTEIHEGGIVRDLGVVASALDATDHQHERAQYLLNHVDIQEDLSRTASVEAAVLAAMTLACNEDGRRVRGEDAFDALLDDFDVTRSEVRRLREAIRETEIWS